jgi:hypothetical protein
MSEHQNYIVDSVTLIERGAGNKEVTAPGHKILRLVSKSKAMEFAFSPELWEKLGQSAQWWLKKEKY